MGKKKVYNILSIFIIIIFILVGYVLVEHFSYYEMGGESNYKEVIREPDQIENNLVVEFIDTGQSDSILIITPGNKVMLIDAGESAHYDKINETLRDYQIEFIDVLIGTHPHSDHIGGMQKVIENYNIGRIYMPNVIHTTKTFENLLIAIEDKGLLIDIAEAGIEINLDESIDLKFVSPTTIFKDDLNNCSAVLRLIYKETSFLFTGDMEVKSERLIQDNIDVDVLKVGHHGSNTSSSEEFLEKVTPEIAVILVGEGNSYNHPSPEVIERLSRFGATIYRTDENGSITIISDGENLEIERSR